MKIWQCYDGLAAQQWYYTGDNRVALTNQGFCLDLTNGATTNANVMQIWQCATGKSHHLFSPCVLLTPFHRQHQPDLDRDRRRRQAPRHPLLARRGVDDVYRVKTAKAHCGLDRPMDAF